MLFRRLPVQSIVVVAFALPVEDKWIRSSLFLGGQHYDSELARTCSQQALCCVQKVGRPYRRPWEAPRKIHKNFRAIDVAEKRSRIAIADFRPSVLYPLYN